MSQSTKKCSIIVVGPVSTGKSHVRSIIVGALSRHGIIATGAEGKPLRPDIFTAAENAPEWEVKMAQDTNWEIREICRNDGDVSEPDLPALPEWTKRDDLGYLVPSQVREEMVKYAQEAVELAKKHWQIKE